MLIFELFGARAQLRHHGAEQNRGAQRLQRVFGPQRGPLAGARAAALGVIDGSGPVRSAIVRYAMGL